MKKPKREELSRFVRQVMNQKGLTQQDVVTQAGGEIGRTYVSQVISNSAVNLSIDKLEALARGLGVEALELFAAASGKSADNLNDKQHTESWRPLILNLLELMGQVVVTPQLVEILETLVKLSPEGQEAVLNAARALLEVGADSRRKREAV